MRVTVTGGAGFIGSHLVDRLMSDGCEVQVIDDLSSGLRTQIPVGVQFVHACITSEQAAQAVTEFAPTHLVHLAAQVDLRVSVEQPVVDAKINVMGTVAMLDAAQSGGSLIRAALASSAAVYGVQQSDAAGEAHPKEPVSAYGAAKLAAEIYWDQFGRLHGVSTGALRFANVYGPRQSPKGEAGVVSIFCRRHAAGQTLAVYGSGEATRDYLYVGDVVEALVLMMHHKDAESVYNLGTGVETSVNALVRQIETVSDQPADVRHETARAGEVARSVLDANLAHLVLGWSPQTNLAQGLTTTFGEYVR